MISLFYSKGMALVYDISSSQRAWRRFYDISVLLKGHGAGFMISLFYSKGMALVYDISVLLKGHGAGFMISLFYSKGMALVL